MIRRERGVAVITAILIVAVAASAATLMLAQQSAMVDQAMLISSRAQADLYARAGIDWARGVLAQDSRAVDSLDEAWAQPIAALPVERALVAGAIADEQGKFNLNNLVRDNQRSNPDISRFQALLRLLGLAPELADAVVDWIDENADLESSGGAEDAYYLSLAKPYRAANAPMAQVEELYRVRGFDAATVAKLRPYVSALPENTLVNANTASQPVLRAVLPAQVSSDAIAKFVQERGTKPARSRDELAQRLQQQTTAALAAADVKSDFFSVRVQVAQDEVELSSEALLRRTDGRPPAMVWLRPRY
ncbi:MAG: type II secretion system minor pseudopilin GspK [Burkholderiales bacterium]|nr:type II secretion system minor pseudopilin GspK [Burkholderiales bacterium]